MESMFTINRKREQRFARESIRFAREHGLFYCTGAAVEYLYKIQAAAVMRAQRERRVEWAEIRVGGHFVRIMAYSNLVACWGHKHRSLDDLEASVIGRSGGGAFVIYDVEELVRGGSGISEAAPAKTVSVNS